MYDVLSKIFGIKIKRFYQNLNQKSTGNQSQFYNRFLTILFVINISHTTFIFLHVENQYSSGVLTTNLLFYTTFLYYVTKCCDNNKYILSVSQHTRCMYVMTRCKRQNLVRTNHACQRKS